MQYKEKEGNKRDRRKAKKVMRFLYQSISLLGIPSHGRIILKRILKNRT
jgi:hypothetical protein